MYGLVRHSCPFHSSHELYTGQDERKGNEEIPWVNNSEEFLPLFCFFNLLLVCSFIILWLFSFWLFFLFFSFLNDDMCARVQPLPVPLFRKCCLHPDCACVSCMAFSFFLSPHDLHAEMATNTDKVMYRLFISVYVEVCLTFCLPLRRHMMSTTVCFPFARKTPWDVLLEF